MLTSSRLILACLALAILAPAVPAAPIVPVPIANGDFSQGLDAGGLPTGWQRYAGSEKATVTVDKDAKTVTIDDQDTQAEIGITQAFPLKPGLSYEVRVKVRCFEGREAGGSYLQFRFLPSGQFTQVPLGTGVTNEWDEVAAQGTAPADTTSAVIYLYSHRDPTPKVMVSDVRVVSGVDAPPPPPPPPPPPVPPVYDKLKDLRLNIPLVLDGKAVISIVSNGTKAYDSAARTLAAEIKGLTGVAVPVIKDTDPGAAVPLAGNVIVLGNRSTNKTSSGLYDNYYSLMDLKYPGAEGYALRSLHDPYGNGFSAILVGASDDVGLAAGTKKLAEVLKAAAKGKNLSLGWLMETKLGQGLTPPTGPDLKSGYDTWEASKGYGSVGYFGWCSISKRMAMYYMTGDPLQAREVIRLAFPDAQAMKEITEIDEERIENKKDPLAGPYHYNAMMLILFWDLIEESPAFTDEERLKVTNAFARRLNHPQDHETYSLNSIPACVGSRHGQWSALALLTLGRYFNKYYPSEMWAHAEEAGKLHFRSLHQHSWISGEADNLFWYNTGMAPILTYMILTGDRKPLANGVLQELLRGQEVLVSGRIPDQNLNSAALDFLNKAAYLTGDGRWITYRERTGLDTNVFRLGQSFWPEETIKPAMPLDLAGKWTINQMPKPMWQTRGTGFKLGESFLNGSFRSAPDVNGDYILLDGYNGASRNPYHTFDILEYRLNGRTLLSGYMNQVLTSADGMVESTVPMDGALRYRDAVGPMALAVGEVPTMPYCGWRRTIAHRTGKYGLIMDDLTFHADSDNMKVATLWSVVSGAWNPKEQAVRVSAPGTATNLPGWVVWRAMEAKCVTNPPTAEMIALLDGLNTVLLRGRQPGQWLEMPFNVGNEVSGELFADMLSYTDRGLARFSLDGKVVGQDFDNWSNGVVESQASLGQVTLKPGAHTLRVEVVGPHPGVDIMNIGLRGLSLKTPQAVTAGTASYFELRPSDVQETTGGAVTTMSWQAPVKKGEHRFAFYLLAQGADGQPPLACVQLAPNAAAVSLPAPGVVSSGEFQKNNAEFALLAADHLVGHKMTSAGLTDPILMADQPVNVCWEFDAGKLELETAAPVKLGLALQSPSVGCDGKRLTGQAAANGLVVFELPAGRHVLTQATPSTPVWKPLTAQLPALVEKGQQARVAALEKANRPVALEGAAWQPGMQASLGAKVSSIIEMNSAQGPLLALAADKVIHVLTPAGQPVRRLETDAAIRNLRWWDKPKLLLAGCADEKLIAFDEQGNRKWTFVSEMHPAVLEAAKQYWFKQAIPGVYGVHTGEFLDGKEQCFIGSACTLEILDDQGQLVKRMPAFWGAGSYFWLNPRADGSIDLLFAKEPTESHALYVLNNKKMELRYAFHGVPAGHTYVGGWANMSRDHLFIADLDGDGKKEAVSEINGIWNRITVWDEDGAPLYNAQFGPGDPIPTRNIRDVDVADLNGDGKQEVIIATSAGLLVVLDAHLKKLWSMRLPVAATVLQAIKASGAPALIVGLENGDVLQLDAQGKTVLRGHVEGQPNKITAMTVDGKPQAVITTAKGNVAGFAY